jgi:CubicO group peptidase (beta-lactamase class C family)
VSLAAGRGVTSAASETKLRPWSVRLRMLVLGFCAAMLMSAPAPAAKAAEPAQASGQVAPEVLQGLDEFINRVLKDWDAPGVAVSIVKDGKVVLSKGYGVRDRTTGAPMTEDTLFPIQSETKAFTAFTVGLLADEGKLSLDAPVATYIPGFRLNEAVATQEVTLRDLLSHRSGLSRYSWLWIANKELSRRDAMGRMPHLPLEAPIRTTWNYANMGYVTAAQAVENLAGVPWERFTEERIIQPLGMTRTTLSAERANGDPNHITGTMWRGGRNEVTPMQGTTPMTYSTGGIYSTANDMTKWMLLQLAEGNYGGKQLIKASALAEMHSPQAITNRPLPPPEFTSAAYGLGWFVESYRGEKLVEHGGGHGGVNSSLGLIPARELGVSVFVNQNSDLAAYLMLSIVDRFLGKGGRDWTREMLAEHRTIASDHLAKYKNRGQGRIKSAPPSQQLAAYAGAYQHPGFGTIAVRLEEGKLTAEYGGDKSPLEHWHYDTFAPTATTFGNVWAMYDDLRVQFVPDFGGHISSLQLSAVMDGITFRRTEDKSAAR